ncbi:MAG: D-Ala-D-Ala carboxypeptidase family metallohydrolase [Alphaproteobacteria bacterium]
MSDLAVPPRVLLASGWFPFIVDFYWRARAAALSPTVRGSVTVISWFRTAEKNRIEGGSAESQHLFALAWDLTVEHGQAPKLAEAAHQVGLVAVPKRGAVHIQMFPAGVLARAGVTFPR